MPLDLAFGGVEGVEDKKHPLWSEIVRPLQEKVKARGLWACHLGKDLGGLGYGQTKLALMNEILGRSAFGPSLFGCRAPDSGNAEILAHYGTDAQKEAYLEPLLNGEISSCCSMTEPQGGADPSVFVCQADRDGDEWVLDGEKWFSSSLRWAKFAIVMAVTNSDAAYRCMKLHGALGVSNEMPIAGVWLAGASLGLADGPTEVHMTTIARHVLKNVEPATSGWPSEHLPERRAAARERFASLLHRQAGPRKEGVPRSRDAARSEGPLRSERPLRLARIMHDSPTDPHTDRFFCRSSVLARLKDVVDGA